MAISVNSELLGIALQSACEEPISNGMNVSPTVLFVQDESAILTSIAEAIRGQSATRRIDLAESPHDVRVRTDQAGYTLVVVSDPLSWSPVEEVIALARASWPACGVVVVGPKSDHRRAVTALRAGAIDYLALDTDPVAERIAELDRTGHGHRAPGLNRDDYLRVIEAAMHEAQDSILVTRANLEAPGPEIVYVNPAFTRLTGYTAEEVLGQSPRILQGPLTDRAVLDRLRNDLTHGASFSGETFNYRKDGTPFRMEWRITPIRDAAGTITHFVSVQRDATERWTQQNQLASRGRQHAALAELALKALLSQRENDDALPSNVLQSVAEALQVDCVELLAHDYQAGGWRFEAGYGWSDPPAQRQPIASGQDGLAAYTLAQADSIVVNDFDADDRFSTPTALRQQGLVSGMTALVLGLEHPYGVLGVYTTRPREFDAADLEFLQGAANILGIGIARNHADRELAQQRLLLETILSQAGDGIVVFAADGSVLFANHAIRHGALVPDELPLSEIRADEWVRCYDEDGQFLPMHEWPAFRAMQGEPQLGQRLIMERLDGSRVHMILSAMPLFGSEGEVWGSVVTLSDVSRLRELEEELRQAQRLESIGRLAGGVAHDFNNLLTGIQGFTALLSRGEADPKRQEDFREVLHLCERAATLTRQLLAFSRKQRLAPKVLDVNESIQSTIRLLQRILGEDIQLELELAAREGQIRADPSQLESILLNLAVNARDAMPQGGVLRLSTSDRDWADPPSGMAPGRYVRISVSDTGCGMDHATLERVFEPFFTTKEVGRGTGLGLAMVYGVVKQHGGEISVESTPGVGTVFHMHWPCQVSQPSAPATLASPQPAPEGPRLTIALVEDNEAVRAVTERMLADSGFRVLVASGPREARQLFAEQGDQVDLLISDVVMPGETGEVLYRDLRQQFPHLKVLFISGYCEQHASLNSPLIREASFLAKPFQPDQLLQAISRVLEGTQAD